MEPRADLILANRAYMEHEAPRGAAAPSAAVNGGLLAAVRPVIGAWDGTRGTTWIGAGRGSFDHEWTDASGYELIPTPQGELRHRRLYFDEFTWQAHYAVVSNSFLWPLLHLVREPLPDLTSYYPRPVLPSAEEWAAYVHVNEAFAEAALREQTHARTCWVHDYQLALVPGMLRGRGFSGRIGFFLHTPFPDLGVAGQYLDHPARKAFAKVVGGMLGADLIGFQCTHDVERFQQAAEELCGASRIDGGMAIAERSVRIDAFPVGVDTEELLAVAREASIPERLTGFRPAGLPLVVGLERNDYTKGIPERLAAITAAYREGLRFAYVGIAAPTREGVPSYGALDEAIASAASEAEAAAHAAGLPFRHAREVIDWSEVVALQREADVVFTSSLADGLNLVPLQGAMAQSLRPAGERGVIITGRDAGVASAFHGFKKDGLVTVNPLDPDDMVSTLRAALAGRPGRVSDRLVEFIQQHDARAWASRFLAELERTC